MFINFNISKVKRLENRHDLKVFGVVECDLNILKGKVVDHTIEEVG